MARPLRVDRANGWYHVTARGIERREIFVDTRSREHFLELLEETTLRFRLKVHAYVLMSNHYHLVVQTPAANLSRAIQWLNVSYVAWFNRRGDRVGPLFQGRFKSVLVEDASWAYELSMYVHLNPVMRKAYGLDKQGKAVERRGLHAASPQDVTRRLKELREYRWSSYRAYAGYERKPDWVTTAEILLKLSKDAKRRTARYRMDIKERLRMGADESRADEIRDAFALGSENFRANIRKMVKAGREVVEPPGLRTKPVWADIVRAVARVTGEPDESFIARRGFIGKPLVLWAARRCGGMTLREVGQAAGGMDYTAVTMSVRRLEQRAAQDQKLRCILQSVEKQCEL